MSLISSGPYILVIPSNNLTNTNNVSSDFELVASPPLLLDQKDVWYVSLRSLLVPALERDFDEETAIFVHCDIVEPEMLAGQNKRVLGIFQLNQSKGCDGSYVTTNLNILNPEYKRVTRTTIQSIRIKILDQYDRPIPFSDQISSVTLEFTMNPSDSGQTFYITSDKASNSSNTQQSFTNTIVPPLVVDKDVQEVALIKLIGPLPETSSIPSKPGVSPPPRKPVGFFIGRRTDYAKNAPADFNWTYHRYNFQGEGTDFVLEMKRRLDELQPDLGAIQDGVLPDLSTISTRHDTFTSDSPPVLKDSSNRFRMIPRHKTIKERLEWMNNNIPEYITTVGSDMRLHVIDVTDSLNHAGCDFKRVTLTPPNTTKTKAIGTIPPAQSAWDTLGVKFKQNGAFNLDSRNVDPTEVALLPIDPHSFRGHAMVVNNNKAIEVCYSFALGFSESLLPYVGIPKSKLSKVTKQPRSCQRTSIQDCSQQR